MLQDLPLTLAQATAPSGDDVPIRPNIPTIDVPSEHPGTTSAVSGTASPAATQQGLGQGSGGGGGSGGMTQILFIVVIFGVFWFVIMGGQRREKKKRAALLSSIKKGDRVQTIGGILGSVVEVRDDEIVLKVDENSNTRIKFTRGAIQTVLADKSEKTE